MADCNQKNEGRLKIFSIMDHKLTKDDYLYILYNFNNQEKMKLYFGNCLMTSKNVDKTLSQVEDEFIGKISNNENLRGIKRMLNRAKEINNATDKTADGLQRRLERKREKEKRKNKLEAALERQRKRKAEYEASINSSKRILVSENKENNFKLYKVGK
uniref:Uncharacterized protein n=1 Tax=Parastrongyloides trichosuri TaxID=131310 RepID=A0A0N4ZJX4_PARTI